MLLTSRRHIIPLPISIPAAQAPRPLASFDLSFGKAHVFYPDGKEDRCTACLMLDVDPVRMVRGTSAGHSFLLGASTSTTAPMSRRRSWLWHLAGAPLGDADMQGPSRT